MVHQLLKLLKSLPRHPLMFAGLRLAYIAAV